MSTTDTKPLVPTWLFDAARQTGPAYGTAIGFAAAGYLAGWEEAHRALLGTRTPTGTGWPSARTEAAR